jgi:mRNA interferase MazF
LTSTIRNIPTEVILNESDGVPRVCAANFDNIQTVPKRTINERIARLSTARMNEVTTAVAFALDLTLAR